MGYDSSFLFGAIVEALNGPVEHFRVSAVVYVKWGAREIKKPPILFSGYCFSCLLIVNDLHYFWA